MVRELDPQAIASASRLYAQVLDQFATGPSKGDGWGIILSLFLLNCVFML